MGIERQFNTAHPEMRTGSTAVVTANERLYPRSFENHSCDIGFQVVKESPEDDDFGLTHGAFASSRSQDSLHYRVPSRSRTMSFTESLRVLQPQNVIPVSGSALKHGVKCRLHWTDRRLCKAGLNTRDLGGSDERAGRL